MESCTLELEPIALPVVNVAKKKLRVLIADDSENDAFILLHALCKAGYEPEHERVWTAMAMKAALEQQTWDMVISDYEMPGFGGFEALQILKDSGKDLPFILVSAVVSEETAVTAMKAGAHDYMMKRKLARLGPAIERELREVKTRAARKDAEEALRQSKRSFVTRKKWKPLAASPPAWRTTSTTSSPRFWATAKCC
jgi:DNA-binding NtrC family response regulator